MMFFCKEEFGILDGDNEEIMLTKVKMGTLQRSFNDGMYQDITLSVTEECNLRCRYCYMTHKNCFSRMSFETARAVVDEILDRPIKFDMVVWNFIGGEPTLEMDLIDKITDYIKVRTFELNHPWFGNSAFFIGSNGLLYESEAVQNYLEKNKGIASISITIDGNKEKHDLQRVYPNGKGSYEDVLRNVKLWISQIPGSKTTKATYSNNDLKYLKDSVISLWEIGIDYVSANVVFEDVWDENAPLIFEQQLRELADYVIDNELWDKYSVRFFDPHVGYQIDDKNKARPQCGSGKMIAVSSAGKYYPCIRFLDFCMGDAEEGYCIGKVGSGINDDLLAPFKELSIGLIFAEKCKTCKIAQGCPSCTGFNYDDSQGTSIYQRTVYHCEMHKAQVRANKYFWMRYSYKTGKASPYQLNRLNRFIENGWNIANLDYFYILTSDKCIPYCDYISCGENEMSLTTLKYVVKEITDRDAFPIVVAENPDKLPADLNYYAHAKIFPAQSGYKKVSELEVCIPVYETDDVKDDMNIVFSAASVCILNVTDQDVAKLYETANILINYYGRVNVNKIGAAKWTDDIIDKYERELNMCREEMSKNGGHLDIMSPNCDRRNCEAGYSSFAICPDGGIYPCPAFYFEGHHGRIGTIEKGVEEKYREIFSPEKQVACKQCDHQCHAQCIHTNLDVSKNISTPAKRICELTAIENNIFEKGTMQ